MGHLGVELPRLAMPELLPGLDLGCCGVSLTVRDVGVLALAGLVAIGGGRLLARHRGGRVLRAAAQDPELLALSGADPAGAQTLAFAVAGGLAGIAAAVYGAACAGLAGALFAEQFGYGEPAQFDFQLSLMVLAAVVIGARWGTAGVVCGALIVAAYDRLLVDALNVALRSTGAAIDLREQNLVVFGLALCAATLARSVSPATRRPSRRARPAPG